MYPGAKRQRSDWWAVLKSRPHAFYVPIVDVAFQENVDIAETSIVDHRIEDIETLTHEIGEIHEVNILGEPKDTASNDDFVNDKVDWEYEDEDSEEEEDNSDP